MNTRTGTVVETRPARSTWPAAAGEIDVDALQRHADELQAEIDDRRRHRL